MEAEKTPAESEPAKANDIVAAAPPENSAEVPVAAPPKNLEFTEVPSSQPLPSPPTPDKHEDSKKEHKNTKPTVTGLPAAAPIVKAKADKPAKVPKSPKGPVFIIFLAVVIFVVLAALAYMAYSKSK